LNLGTVVMALLRTFLNKEEFTEPALLAQKIKAFPLQIQGFGALDEAISTVGGIALEEVDGHFELKNLPNHYCIGEMLDWDAPTGGYLLQACFSMGYGLAKHLNGR
jgi:predicted flavoprotein YhiN